MSQSNTPNRMTALGLLEQMRRAGANREPEFNPITATLRERRAAPTAPLFGGQRQQALPTPPRPPQQPQQAQALPIPPRPPVNPQQQAQALPPAILPQAPGAEPTPLHERFNPENPHVATAIQMAERYGLPRNVFLSVINRESAFRPDAVSGAGAIGFGQLMPGTARELGVDPTDPAQNLEGSARYLRQMLDRHKGDMPLALASYNAGPGRVQRAGNTIPNNPETQAYVPGVLRDAGVPGYAMGGLAELEHKYEGGGLVGMMTGLARRATRRTPALRPDEVPMVAMHNARQVGLEKIANNDGVIVAPSIGISRADDPMDSFGDISLIASPQTIDPRRTPVYGRDAYTPRYPSVIPMTVRGREKDYVRLYNDNTGETRLLPHTPKNALRVMTNDPWRGGEDFITDNWLLGQITPQFKNMSELRGARDRLVPGTDNAAQAWQNELGNLRGEWRDALPDSIRDNFNFIDSHTRNLAEAAQRGPGGMQYINHNYYNNAIPPELLERTEAHLNAGRDLPTTYFEAKPRRIVPLNEFQGAVVPSSASQDVTDLLRRYGVDDVRYYDNPDDRAEQIRQYRQLMFGAAPVAAGAAMSGEGEAAPEPEGYAEGGLADLHQKYESGGRVRRAAGAVRRAVRGAAPEPTAPIPPAPIPSAAMTPDEAMALATAPQPGAGVPRLEGADLERANELSQRVLDFRASQMRLPPKARVQPRPEDQLFPAARFDQPLEAGPSTTARDLEALRIQNIAPDQSLPGSRAAAGLASDLASRYGTTMDRIVGDLDPIARIMRGEEVPGATPAQIASARAGEFYNMRPVYDVLRGQGVSHDEALRRIRQESQAIAGTSPRTDTEQNVLNSAFLQNRMARGLPVDAASVQASTGPGSGYGMIYDQHPALTEGLLEGTISLAQNPKPTVFGRNISGDRSAVTADVHNVRAVNMLYNDVNPGELPASSFGTAKQFQQYRDAYTPDAEGVVRGMNDAELRKILVARPSGQDIRGQNVSTEYPIYNDITTNIAERLGLTPADAQALMWFHYGPRTGLASEAHTVPELLNQRMSITSQALDIPPEEVLRLYSRNMIPLAGAAPVAILAGEGEAAPSLEELGQRYAEGGRVMSDEEYDRRLLERMKTQTGRTTESTNAEQAAALRSAGYDAAQLASDIFMPQSPLDAALMVALGPGPRMARMVGSAALAAMEPSEAQAGGLRRLIRAYHGTPYRFDEFDSRKIGTGEGAQAFGRGLYFAEDEGVAKGYRDTLSRDTFLTPEGAVWSPRDLQHLNVRVAATRNPEDLESAIRRGEGLLSSAPPETRNLLESDLNVLNALRDAGGVTRNPGNMYEVNLNASPRDFLNWDRSLGQQSPEVQESLARLDPSMYRSGSDDYDPSEPGQMIYQRLQSNLGEVETPNALMRMGIPGTRYFDAGSRGIGSGTSNYAVFDPEIIDITRRYAQGGLAQLEHKYAEGGAVSGQPAIYDPDAVNALANQIEANYV